MGRTVTGIFKEPGARLSVAIGVSLAVIVAAVYVLLHVVLAPAQLAPNGAERAVTTFYTAVEHQQYATAYAWLSDAQQARLTEYSFAQLAAAQDRQYGPVTSFHEVRFDRDTNNLTQATIQERASRSKEQNYLVTLTMIQQPDGTWKILDEDRPI